MDDPLMVYLTLIENFLQMFLETAGLTVDHGIWMRINVTFTLHCDLFNVQQPVSTKKMNALYFRNPYSRKSVNIQSEHMLLEKWCQET